MKPMTAKAIGVASPNNAVTYAEYGLWRDVDVTSHLPQDLFPPTKLLLTVRDCSAMTSLSEKTVRRLLQRGKLRCLNSIRHKRIPASELARFIRDNLS